MNQNGVWNLEPLYPGLNSPEFQADLKKLEEQVAALNPEAPWEEFWEKRNELEELARRLTYYPQLLAAADAENEEALRYAEKIERILAGLAPLDAAFQQRLNRDGLPPHTPEQDFFLKEQAALGAHTLSPAEEALAAKLSATGAGAWSKLRQRLTSTLSISLNGETHPLPTIRAMAYSEDAALRKAAYEAELAAYPAIAPSVAAALNGIKGEAITLAEARGYQSPLEQVLLFSRLERPVLTAMLSACFESLPDFRRYFRAKARLLQAGDALPFADLFAPVGSFTDTFTYPQAQEFILKQFGAFSPRLADYARMAFDNDWIDVYPRPGKEGGAFCENLHCIGESRILANFTGSLNDVLTLAHELGHGYHGDCLNSAAPLNSDYPMPIAETASTFCETLVKQAALKTASPAEALTIREADISDSAQVIVDILSRYLFEDRVFAARQEGPLSPEALCDMMLQAQKDTYGDGLATYHPYMWVCKVHYYDPTYHYYNFPYAFGLLFAKGLYRIYRETPAGFPERYAALLAASGHASLADLGNRMGFALEEPAFWQGAFAELKTEIDAFVAEVDRLTR